MSPVSSLPAELLIDISEYLRPHTPVIGGDAAWSEPSAIRNWWDKSLSRQPIPPDGEGSEITDVDPLKSSYSSLLALRSVNRQFNAICTPFLYRDFNHLGYGGLEEHIATEVISRYHSHIRAVRISAERSGYSEAWRRVYDLLFFHPPDVVTSLGVYFDNYGDFEDLDCTEVIADVVNSLSTRSITSFGIYSSSAFDKLIRDVAPEGATKLLNQVLYSNIGITHLNSLDVVMDKIEEQPYDALRTQITHLRSLTIRAALRRNLQRMWDTGQQEKWFKCNNLTVLQLLHCKIAYAPHIAHVLRFFPSLRILFLSGCGDHDDYRPPPREKGWSFRPDAVWGMRSPLESFHLECVIDWEIAALGVIHTETLIITTVARGDVVNSFVDEEIFPCLRVLKTEGIHLNPTMKATCAKRGITIESDAKALVFWDE